jgi:Methyltransferase domain
MIAQGNANLSTGSLRNANSPRYTVESVYIKKKSLPYRFRERRFQHIQPLIEAIIRQKGTCRIADIGGTHYYWKIAEEFVKSNPVEIDLINLSHVDVCGSKFRSLTGDACALDAIADNSYDLVHSNSVIEHVGNWDRMTRMAHNVRRLAPQYYVQTPNVWFPYEPHFRVPFFHWLPEPARAAMLMRFNLGFGGKRANLDAAMRGVQSATLISAAQMRYLFPDAAIVRERAFGLSKSLMAIRASQ